MKILAIESSCDETAAAVVENGTTICSSVVATSSALHQKYGGILPELASREQLKCILPVLTQTMEKAFPDSYHHIPILDCIKKEIDAIAVTIGPGLIGSLLIGVETAKTIAWVSQKPIIPVNHVLAHIYANFVETSNVQRPTIEFPAIALVVSGGHTELFLMKSSKELQWLGGTIDDAAGEAFDKSARLLGFGNRGGVAIQEAAKQFNENNSPCTVSLPRPMMHDKTLNFSFSGLKTAISREWNKTTNHTQEHIAAFAYEIQEAITDVVVKKTVDAAANYSVQSILIAGGVAANTRLREKFTNNQQSAGITIHFPPIEFCTDNAVVIGSYAFFRGNPQDWKSISATPDLSVEET